MICRWVIVVLGLVLVTTGPRFLAAQVEAPFLPPDSFSFSDSLFRLPPPDGPEQPPPAPFTLPPPNSVSPNGEIPFPPEDQFAVPPGEPIDLPSVEPSGEFPLASDIPQNGDGLDGPGDFAGQRRSPFHAGLFWVPSQPLTTQPGNLSLDGQSIDLAGPLSIERGNVWLWTANLHRLGISTNAILPDTFRPLPSDLWKIGVGVMNFRTLESGSLIGGVFNVGAASDQPFDGIRDMTVTFIGFWNIPSGERNAWCFSLFYSPTAQIIFPLPGIAYLWRPDNALTMKIGLPLSIDYQPNDVWSFSASYMPLTNLKMMARRRLGPVWSAYGGYEISNDIYWLSDRVIESDRLFIYDQRLKLGLSRDIGEHLQFDLCASYVFDRQIFQAARFAGSRHDQIGIESGMMFGMSISWHR